MAAALASIAVTVLVAIPSLTAPTLATDQAGVVAAADRCASVGALTTETKEASIECWRQLVYGYITSGQGDLLDRYLYDRVRGDDVENGWCHAGAHLAGQDLYALLGDDQSRLREVNISLCSSGAIHGYLIAYGAEPHPESSWQALIDLCSSSTVSEVCADGIGHALFHSDRERWLAGLERCVMFADRTLRIACGAGVVMDMYLEREDTTPEPAEMLDLCAKASRLEESLQAGCAAGIGYVAGQAASEKLTFVELANAPVIDDRLRQRALDGYRPGLAMCEISASPVECFSQLANSGPSLIESDRLFNTTMCALVRDPEARAYCDDLFRV